MCNLVKLHPSSLSKMIIKSKHLYWLLLSGLVSAEVDHEEYGGVHHKQAAEHKA